MVPMLTCGLVRSNFALATGITPLAFAACPSICYQISTTYRPLTQDTTKSPSIPKWRGLKVLENGAGNQDRTGDLILTMDALYLLSYAGMVAGVGLEPTTSGL